MNAPSNPTCPACGSTHLGEPIPCKDHFVTQETFHLRECLDCEFKFTSDAPDAEHIGRYYKSDAYISHSGVQAIAGHTRVDLLDIGAAPAISSTTWPNMDTGAGIEVDADARAYAAAQFGLKVDGTEVVYQENRTNAYDVITLWHVLEHLYDASAYLKWMNQALKPDGVLVIAIPNHASLDASVYGSDWAAYDPPRHHRHFKPGVLDAFIKPTASRWFNTRACPAPGTIHDDAKYGKTLSATRRFLPGCGQLEQPGFSGNSSSSSTSSVIESHS